jgi:peptidoglycan/xylan/chitin deacetylase (PgdA/CDA1 family)
MNVLPLIVTGPSPTPEWVWNPPGEVVAPILLYHHIAEKTPPSRYFLPPQVFEQQILSLQRWGYTVIPLSLLATAIQEGAMLPPKPVVITFDDGYKDVFKQAFPILQQYGYVGAVYPIVKQIGTRGYMDGADLKQLAEAGWEIGSHSWTHTSLRSSTVNLEHEIVDSRKEIKDLLGLPVLSFSFPYGLTSKYVTKQVKEANYQFAVGLGISYRHTEKTLYYLSRIEVRSDYDINEFAALLPWSDIHIQPTQTPNDR